MYEKITLFSKKKKKKDYQPKPSILQLCDHGKVSFLLGKT